MPKINLIGDTYGRLLVIREENSVGYRRFFTCKCICNNVIKVSMSHLRTGHTTSCGCLSKEYPKNFKHGYSKTNLYKVWDKMWGRCHRLTDPEYNKYGAKGITVCDDWANPLNFINWAVKNGYQKGLTIDRKNTYGNYDPNNCRWVTANIQGINKRISIRNSSGYVGVNKKGNKWVARITVNSVRIDIGRFNSPEEANTARLNYIKSNNLSEHLLTYENQQRYN